MPSFPGSRYVLLSFCHTPAPATCRWISRLPTHGSAVFYSACRSAATVSAWMPACWTCTTACRFAARRFPGFCHACGTSYCTVFCCVLQFSALPLGLSPPAAPAACLSARASPPTCCAVAASWISAVSGFVSAVLDAVCAALRTVLLLRSFSAHLPAGFARTRRLAAAILLCLVPAWFMDGSAVSAVLPFFLPPRLPYWVLAVCACRLYHLAPACRPGPSSSSHSFSVIC